MKSKSQLTLLALIASASVIFGMVLAGGLNLSIPGFASAGDAQGDRPLHAAARDQMAAGQLAPGVIPASFADIAARVNPAVVSITSREVVRQRSRRPPGHPRQTPGDPFEFFFGPERFRGPQQEGEPDINQSGGSGFLISDDGYILTNYHVVQGADKIRVNLSGDRHEYIAEVVGSDPATDLALIRIKAGARLPYLKFGDSEVIRVGDWVVAVGNPLAYDHTVTVGVVSAKGRSIRELSRDFSLDNFIQTDAAINFGNSGGPLVNLSGEVVGVNTAISSVGQGIGFAVPINTARDVLDQLKTKGKVSRGYLGIFLEDVPPDIQEAFGLKGDKGAFVQRVEPGKPGDSAGIKKGDVIIAVDGRPMVNTKEVVRTISAKEPGSSVRLTLLRDGKEISVTAKLDERPLKDAEDEEGEETGGPVEEPNEKLLGIAVETLTPENAGRLDLPTDTKGVLVRRVSKLSQAYEKGIGEADVITEVNRVPVASVADFRREIKKVKPGGLVVFYVISPSVRTQSDPVSRYVTVRLQESE